MKTKDEVAVRRAEDLGESRAVLLLFPVDFESLRNVGGFGSLGHLALLSGAASLDRLADVQHSTPSLLPCQVVWSHHPKILQLVLKTGHIYSARHYLITLGA